MGYKRSGSRPLLRLVLLATVNSEARHRQGQGNERVTQPPIRVGLGLLVCVRTVSQFLNILNSSKPELLDKRIVCQVEISVPPADDVPEPVEPVLDRLLH